MTNIDRQTYPRIYRDEDRLNKDNATLVLIDHQTGLLSACRDIPTEQLYSNILALAKIGKVFNLPVILTQGGYGGEDPFGNIIEIYSRSYEQFYANRPDT